jgi:hypothetical protein
MNLEASLIPYGQLSSVLPGMIPYLQKSEFWTMGRSNIDDILRFLFTGEMMLWLAYDPADMKVYGYNITEIKIYPQCKMLVVQYTAGEPNHMQFVEERMHEILDRFARDAGCAGIESFGRPGWGPHLKKYGYNVRTVVYEKFFDGEPQ